MEKTQVDVSNESESQMWLRIGGVLALLCLILWAASRSHSSAVESASPPPALWSIRAHLRGDEPTVGDLTRSRTLHVSMNNFGCPEEERRRCCRAVVLFDAEEDRERARRLCSEIEGAASGWQGDHGGVTSTLLDRFVDHDRFELLYSDRFGIPPTDRELSISFVDDH